MNGVGPPLVTPFTENGDVDVSALQNLVAWIEEGDVDFLVPCGSNSEAELMTAEERTRVIEATVEAASVPVIAGTGSPGLRETRLATAAAADAGADAALVTTPFYYNHDQETLAKYYRDLADAAPIPIYLYSIPAYTGLRLTPETVEGLADHPNIAGMKDSAGDVAELIRAVRRTADAEFDVMVGSASILAQALDAGATGGVNALANLLPGRVSEIYRTHATDAEAARALNADLVEINHAITRAHGVPGLKYAMRQRGAPAGHPRSPHTEAGAAAKRAIDATLDAVPDR